MISALYMINLKGEVVIYRSYRDDVSRSAADAFRMQVLASKDFRCPIRMYENSSFFHIRDGNMYIVAVTMRNANASLVFHFLLQLISVFKAYFGGAFDEDTVRNNFVLIYELLDECCDYGYPQNCAADVLKQYILQEGNKSEGFSIAGMAGSSSSVPEQVTGGVSWRREGIRYKRNEVFLDVVEHVNLLMSAKGTVLSSDVEGEVLMKSFLSGMPECKFGMNDKLVMDREPKKDSASRAQRGGQASAVELDDLTFHQCVKLGKFDSDRTVSFIPPDGEFTLMKYRCTENVNLPFRVLAVIKEHGRTRLEANVKVKANFNVKLFALNVVIRIPLPSNTAVARMTVAAGKGKYEPENQAMVWRIRRFPGDAEYQLSAEVDLTATMNDTKKWSRPPISMEFQVPMYTSSGLAVRFLKIFEKSGYQTVKWVRYITKHGQYQYRI
jgi:AP-2 complex subunit mu-1